MDCFAPLAMTIKFTTQDLRHTSAISPHAREFCISYIARLKIRGRRESRVLVAPAASRAK
jgi:hypothetical protein